MRSQRQTATSARPAASGEERRARERERPADDEADDAEDGERERAGERPDERRSRAGGRRGRRALRDARASGLHASTKRRESLAMGATARRAAVATLVVGGIVVARARALEDQDRHRPRLPRLHHRRRDAARRRVAAAARTAAPRRSACSSTTSRSRASSRSSSGSSCRARSTRCSRRRSTSAIHQQATHSTGIKHDILTGLDKRLRRLPSGTKIVHPAVEVTKTAFEVLVGIFFMFAVGAYWIFERDRTIGARAVDGAAEAPPRHPRHVGADRPEARRVRARPAAPDRLRRGAALDGLLRDRAAVLAADRHLRRRRRDRARDRPARRRRARDRRRADADRERAGGERADHRHELDEPCERPDQQPVRQADQGGAVAARRRRRSGSARPHPSFWSIRTHVSA